MQSIRDSWGDIGVRLLYALAACLIGLALVFAPRWADADPNQGPGGPILVVTSSSAPFGNYYAEILRAEGLSAFTVADVSTISASTLANHDVVILAKVALSASQVSTLTTWVNGGGNLIAMAPDGQLAPLLGLTPAGGTLAEGYLLVDTSKSPGSGIVNRTMQFHGVADRYNLSGASSVATLYSTSTTPTVNPAVTLRSVGAGKAAAFAFDLATSIVYTRQGNPAWASQERDGFPPIRSDDKFFGAREGDVQPDWVDLNKVDIPQADEQQRLLANLILLMNQSRKPLPRFWYFPNGKKAVVVMTGDDHGNGGTAGRFDQYKALSAPGCSVDEWACVRGTSYIYPNTPISDAQAAGYHADGFEAGVHITTGCADYTPASLDAAYAQQVQDWRLKFPSLPAPITQRHHCIAWSDWTTGALVQFSHGMRLDTSYYYWPPSWVNGKPGMFTGSAMPMRFSALDGKLIDVYMAATQMTDESGQAYPFTVDTLLDRALGPEGYYGAYVANMHTDVAHISESDAIIASAQARGVSVISSRQLLTWVDARNASSFGALSWSGSALSFTVNKDPAARGLQAMLPLHFGGRVLSGITLGASSVPFTVSAIKGVDYAVFAANGGAYVASYAADATAPSVVSTAPPAGATGVAVTTAVAAVFNESLDPSTVNAGTFELRDAANTLIPSVVSYSPSTRTVSLQPSGALSAGVVYTATLRGGGTDPRIKDIAGNAMSGNFSWSFTAGSVGVCPCSGWDSTATPTVASANDPNAVELGVKFRSDVAGYITGIRFYKGAGNTGTHVGNLWTAAGQLLASATFTGETATGWQQVTFSNPVAIAANTVYVASYFAPVGRYAIDTGYFAANGVDNGPIHLLSNAAAGGNGVYAYASSSSFPASSWNSSNYWVDVVFTTSGSSDTTPPTVTQMTPGEGSTGVSTSTTVAVTFNEAMDPATIGTSTIELRTPSNELVSASVSYNSSTRVGTLTPASTLAPLTTYMATVRGGTTDPRVKDLAGNALASSVSWSFTTAPVGGACGAPTNAIVGENCLTGSPSSEWDVNGAGDPTIQGFATQISVNRGTSVSFKVKTDAANYRFDIYRMGYYGGLGARKVATVMPSASLPQSQPSCLTDSATGLIDCGNWAVSGSWAVPATAVSGIYFAKLVRADTGGASHIVFVVRDDAGASDILFQTADATWQAYNNYGGNSLYTGSPAGRAYKVSYNRPFNTRAVDGGQDWVFNAEYPMVRWLEANGYSVSYFTGADSDRFGSLIRNHKVFVSVGHDEYWSAAQRSNVEAARDAGVNLAFFSGNEVFWKTRWENSIDGSGTSYRTLVSYKETHANAKIDPSAAWTGTWRDPRFSPPADGGKPENALTGTIFSVNAGADGSIVVPEADGKMRFWRNTSVATLAPGTVATMPFGTLGYEWDVDADNGSRPAGLIRLSSTTMSGVPVLQDHGSTYAAGSATHSLTLYRHSSGARVFGAGTIQWSWGLDANHDRAGTPVDIRMQQATVNLFADMGTQPGSLQSGLIAASASTDAVAPSSAITSPTTGATLAQGVAFTISGTASDAGGGVVGGVEVSIDGGVTWRRANGRTNWTYSWTPTASGTVTIRSRAADDSGNVESPSAGVTVTVGGTVACPCTIWPTTATPAVPSAADGGAVNLGVKFRADVNGYITGIRFYKGSGNTGTHIGALWSSTGTLLASATFTGETSSGWQQVNFASPVAITAGTMYVASYLAPNGRYSIDVNYFASTGVDNGPLHALQNGVSGGNGVYAYNTGLAFPSASWNSSNYWVDVVLTTADTTPPTISARTPAAGATGVATTSTVTVTFSEPMDASTINTSTIELRNPSGVLVPATVSYNAGTGVATLTPSAALSGLSTYAATVRGGGTDPRVKDSAGNALVANSSWSFTTAAADTTPPTVTARTPAAGATGVTTTSTVTVTFSEPMDPSTINTSTIELRNPSSVLVAATVSYDAGTRVATLTPSSALAGSATYTATVRGGGTDPRVKDLAGNALAANSAWSFTTAVADTTPPTVTARTPPAGATGVPTTNTVTVTFSEPMDASTINTGTIELRNPSSALVPATVTYDPGTRVATLTPSTALTTLTTFTATVRGGAADPRVKDLAGNALAANSVWSFTTAGPICPCTIWASSAVPTNITDPDTASVNLGVKFRSDVNGYITGIRFYKGSANTGTHIGTLWSSTGTQLASATFTGESSSGWQQVNFATPVAITAGTVYVASYLAPNGRYAGDNGFFASAGVDNGPLHALQNGVSGGNGVYAYSNAVTFPSSTWNSSNYWVDVVFTTTPP